MEWSLADAAASQSDTEMRMPSPALVSTATAARSGQHSPLPLPLEGRASRSSSAFAEDGLIQEGQIPPSPSSASVSEGGGMDDGDLSSTSRFAVPERRATTAPRNTTAVETAMLNADPLSPANLPHEIIVHIFKFLLTRTTGHANLYNCLQVCRSWCLCGVELLWHRPAFTRISSLKKMITVIEGTGQDPQPIFAYAGFIRRLNYSGIAAELRDEHVHFMAQCTNLERLALSDCAAVTDQGLCGFLGSLKSLLSIDLTNVDKVSDAAVQLIAANCHRLQGLNFTNCKLVTSAGIAALGEQCRLLRRVKLCGCELITNEGLLPIFINCPLLLEIDLYGCPLVGDAAVRQIWITSNHVRELRLANCGPLTDAAFPAPARRFAGSSTTALDLPSARRLQSHGDRLTAGMSGGNGSESAPTSRGASPDRARALQDPDSAMEPVKVEYQVTIPLSVPLKAPKMFEHLRILDLTNCSTISDDAIEGIIACAPRIRNLMLSKCTRLTDESVYSIAKLKKNLQFLHLGHVSNITDRAVRHLVDHCTRLRYFDLACCTQLTDLAVTELAAKLPKLKRIGLVRVVQITDNALYSLVERHLNLQRIHLSYCENISVAAVFWLLEKLPKVTHISLTGVPAFRRPDLQKMCREPPEEFSDHQRSSFCVFSGAGVGQLQEYLRGVYSSQASAAAFGEVTPEVDRAIALVAEAQERRQGRRTHFSRGGVGQTLPPHPTSQDDGQALYHSGIRVSSDRVGRSAQPAIFDHDQSRFASAAHPIPHPALGYPQPLQGYQDVLVPDPAWYHGLPRIRASELNGGISWADWQRQPYGQSQTTHQETAAGSSSAAVDPRQGRSAPSSATGSRSDGNQMVTEHNFWSQPMVGHPAHGASLAGHPLPALRPSLQSTNTALQQPAAQFDSGNASSQGQFSSLNDEPVQRRNNRSRTGESSSAGRQHQQQPATITHSTRQPQHPSSTSRSQTWSLQSAEITARMNAQSSLAGTEASPQPYRPDPSNQLFESRPYVPNEERLAQQQQASYEKSGLSKGDSISREWPQTAPPLRHHHLSEDALGSSPSGTATQPSSSSSLQRPTSSSSDGGQETFVDAVMAPAEELQADQTRVA